MASRTFARNITRFVEKTGISADQVLRKLGIDAYYGVLLRSPVDTGRYRASHRLSVNRIDPSVEPDRKQKAGGLFSSFGVSSSERVTPGSPPTAEEQARALTALAGVRFGSTIYITNNLPYAIPLENGHSKQAANGVYSQAFNELVRKFGDAVRTVTRSR